MEPFRVKEAQQRVSNDHWDIDAWMVLFVDAQHSPFADAKPVYERLVAQFPPSGKIWRTYAEHMARDTHQPIDEKDASVIALFERAVIDAPASVELWNSYATFISNRVVASTATDSSSLEAEAISVFERAVSTAGTDIKADVLWNRYLSFLMNHTSMTDTQRRDFLRRVHQRAVMLCTVFSPLLPCLCLLVSSCVLPLFSCQSLNLEKKKKEFLNHPWFLSV